jgi:hypothetical protein
MDHTEAIDGRFTERYLLGELTPAQRDQFEEHFFDCASCADDVQTGAVFVDNARTLLREQPISEETAISSNKSVYARYGLPFQSAALAFVALLCVVGYENVVTIPDLKKAHSSGISAPEVLPTVSLLGMGSRAASNPVSAPLAKDFVFELEIPGSLEFTSYACEIRDQAGTVKFNVPVTTQQAQETVRLAVPSATLGAGTYKLEVIGEKAGGAEKELVQYPIQIH